MSFEEMQHQLGQAIEACENLGKDYADCILARDGLERVVDKLSGAVEVMANSREMWRQRALDRGWQPRALTLADEAVRADIEGYPDPWNPTGLGGALATLAEAVSQALGSATMAWRNVAAAGEFDEAWCTNVYDGLMAYLADWSDSQVKYGDGQTMVRVRHILAGILDVTPPEHYTVTNAIAAFHAEGILFRERVPQ